MNKPVAYLCLALWLALGHGYAQAVFWSDGFETNGASRWDSVGGVWQVGSPTAGPPLDASRCRAHNGLDCASTQNYPAGYAGTLYCTNYGAGSNTLIIPSADVAPTFNCYVWCNLSDALGYVEVKAGTNAWQQISTTYENGISGNAWLLCTADLSSFAGEAVQIGIYFQSGNAKGNNLGMYVDDVSVTVTPLPPVLTVPDNQLLYAGEELLVTNYATNDYLPEADYLYSLLSAPANMKINSSGVISWPTADTQPSSTNTVIVQVSDNSDPPLVTTNSFTVTLLNPWIPQFTVPATQTIFAGQSLTATMSATNTFFPNSTFTFEVLSAGPTNMDESDLADGIMSWDGSATRQAGTYTNVVAVTDNDPPYYSATNSFLVVISAPPPPVLTVPGTQTLYAGQVLTVTNEASSVAFPGGAFTFALLSNPANIDQSELADYGIMTLTTYPTNKTATQKITLMVTDDQSGLSATDSFQVLISPTPPPIFILPGTVTNYGGMTLTVTNYATNVVFSDAQFSFRLPAKSTNYCITTNGVLTWTNTGIKNGILIWTNNSIAPGLQVITLAVDTTLPGYSNLPISGTNHFDMVFMAPHPPSVIISSNLEVFVGQMVTVTNGATNNYVVLTNASYTFKAISTNVQVAANGVMNWTNTALPPGIYGIAVKVTDNSVPPLSSTNSSATVTVLPLPSQLAVSKVGLVASTNGGRAFALAINSPWTNTAWRVEASTNVAAPGSNWVPIYTNPGLTNTFLIITDSVSTNLPHRFYRAVYP